MSPFNYRIFWGKEVALNLSPCFVSYNSPTLQPTFIYYIAQETSIFILSYSFSFLRRSPFLPVKIQYKTLALIHCLWFFIYSVLKSRSLKKKKKIKDLLWLKHNWSPSPRINIYCSTAVLILKDSKWRISYTEFNEISFTRFILFI